MEGKWYIQHAEASVLQEFPRECFFEKSFQVLNIALNSAPHGILQAKFISLLVFLSRGRNRFRGVASRVGGKFQTLFRLSQ